MGKRISQLKLRIIDEYWQALSFFGGLIVICGFIVVGFQVLFWLKGREWLEVSLLGSFYFVVKYLPETFRMSPEFKAFMLWLSYPRDWQGLHKIVTGTLEFIPLSFFLVVVGGLAWLTGFANKEEALERKNSI